MAKDRDINRVILNSFIILIAVTVGYLMVISNTALKINNSVVCGRQDLDQFSNQNLEPSLYLDNVSDFVLQRYVVKDDDFLYYSFCFRLDVHTSNGVRMRVIDHNNNTYGYSYLLDGNVTDCIVFNGSSLKEDNYLGLVCENCGRSYNGVINNVTLYEQLGGADITRIFGDYDGVGYTQVYEDNPLYMELIGSSNCKQLLRDITFIYFAIIFFVGLGLLIMVGYKAFIDRINEGF